MLLNPLSNEEYQIRYQPEGCPPYHSNDKHIRSPFFRDITAIAHSVPFRKLKRKTQVFFAPEDDQICTRIEHVLHVFTNSTTICQKLIERGEKQLNLNMVQAIALGHDIGHAPFGHAGETVLNEIMKKDGMQFQHELHGLRCVDHLAGDKCGLYLSYGVRDGIVCHCGEKLVPSIVPTQERIEPEDITTRGEKNPATYEGCIVRIADKISSLGRDIEDAVILSKQDLLHAEIGDTGKYISIYDLIISEMSDILETLDIRAEQITTKFNSECLNIFNNDVCDFTQESEQVGLKESFELLEKINKFSEKYIYPAREIKEYKRYVEFMINGIFRSLEKEHNKNNGDITKLKKHYINSFNTFGNHLDQFQEFYRKTDASLTEKIVDFIASMSDQYVIRFFQDISIPKVKFK